MDTLLTFGRICLHLAPKAMRAALLRIRPGEAADALMTACTRCQSLLEAANVGRQPRLPAVGESRGPVTCQPDVYDI